jgi:hypothetical protein
MLIRGHLVATFLALLYSLVCYSGMPYYGKDYVKNGQEEWEFQK